MSLRGLDRRAYGPSFMEKSHARFFEPPTSRFEAVLAKRDIVLTLG
jgi:hypothetical protein